MIHISFDLFFGGLPMPLFNIFQGIDTSALLATEEKLSPMGWIITELVLCVVFIALVFLFKPKLAKIICACCAEFLLWLACDQAFPDTILSTIMTWFTAFVAIVVVISIVNHIDWSNLRGKKR